VLRKMMDGAKAEVRRPHEVAHVATMKGDRSLALDWLEKSYQHRDYWMLYINVDPEYDALRSALPGDHSLSRGRLNKYSAGPVPPRSTQRSGATCLAEESSAAG
jgi:hypothetical protein